MIKFVSDLLQVGGFLLVLPFPPPIIVRIKIKLNYNVDVEEVQLKGILLYIFCVFKVSLNSDGQQFHQYGQNE